MGFFSRLFGGSGGSTPAAKPASAPPAKKPERIESSAEAAWRVKIQEGLSHAKNKDWGLYTNARLDLGQMAMKERRHRIALDHFLEVSYLDLNGPNNSGLPWRASEGMLAPQVVEWIWDLATECGLGSDELEGIFKTIADKQKTNLRLRVEPETAWKKLRKALQEVIRGRTGGRVRAKPAPGREGGEEG